MQPSKPKKSKGITIKQEMAFKEIMENRGNISKAMIKCGYSKVTAKNPKNLTNSLGWKRLLEEYLPDELLGQRHNEGLSATKYEQRLVGRDDGGGALYEYKEIADYGIRHKYLVTAYKIKGKFPREDEVNNKILIQIKQY